MKVRINQYKLLIVIIITIIWSISLLILQIMRFNCLGAYAFDLGIFQQAVWLMSQGKTPFVSVRGMHIFGDHFTPILYLLAIPYRFWAHPFWLFLAQTLALASGVCPLYRLALRRTRKEWVTVLIVLGYLFHPALFTMLLFDFHPLLLSVPFVLWAMDAVDSGQVVYFALAACFAALCREDVAIILIGVSMYGIIVHKHRWAWGGLIFSLVWFWLVMKIMAYLSGSEHSAYLSLYARWGETPVEIIWGIVTRPIEVIKSLIFCHGYVHIPVPGIYPLLLITPFAMFPLLAPQALIGGLPSYALIALSDRLVMRELGYQYGSLVVPWLALAAALAWENLLRLGDDLPVSLQRRWEAMLTLTWISCVTFGACQYGLPAIQRFMRGALPPEKAKAIITFIYKYIPPNASVSAPTNLIPILAHRERVYLFPNPIYRVVYGPSTDAIKQQMQPQSFHVTARQVHQRVKFTSIDFIILRKQANTLPLNIQTYESIAIYLLICPYYGIIAHKDNIIILRRNANFMHGMHIIGISGQKIKQDIIKAISDMWKQLQE